MQGVPPLIGNTVAATLARFFIYLVVIFGFTVMLPGMAENGRLDDFSESNLIENAQFSILVLTALAFLFYSTRRRCGCGALCSLLGTLVIFACFREQDAVFDGLLYLRWEMGILPFLLACYYAGTRPEFVKKQLEVFVSTRAFAMLWAGFVVAIPFAQLVGHGPFLEALMGAGYERNYTRVIEESSELVGYFLLLAGSIECVAELRNAMMEGRL